VGLERGPLTLVSTVEELLERKRSGPGLDNQDYGRRNLRALTTRHPLSAEVFLTSQTSGIRSVGIVRSPNRAKELFIIKPNMNTAQSKRREFEADVFIIVCVCSCVITE
jgi:hypothetical protein